MNVHDSRATRRAVLGIDTGGTFTDVTLLDPASGQVWNAKVPSTPDDPSRGFADGIAKVLEVSGTPPQAVGRVLHGTTVATNLILESKGPRTAMLVTDGFKFVVEIGRQDVPRGQHLHAWVKPKRPTRPRHIWEVKGRIDPQGNELEKLDEDGVRRSAREMAAEGIDAIAIVFLHSYASGAHERRAAELIREVTPNALISLSSVVMPVFREYERSMTTNLNAYVMSTVASYVAKLESRLKDIGITAPLLLMKSSGGVTSARSVRERPVETALSGPAAGTVGANFVGRGIPAGNLIGIDIGGTSADISLIHNGNLGLTDRGRVGSWPVGLPMVDISTIGAGGGSIARLSAAGVLTVGPESAGAVPGPVCYRRGGSEPTVTDAHLVLGHLPPYLLSGSFKLDIEAARAAIRAWIADPLRLTVEQAARGILQIIDNNMVGAVRVISVERGFDPRDFVLLPFGGAGPMHSSSIARTMGIKTIVVPPAPGVLSALGLLASDLKAEFQRTSVQKSGNYDLPALARIFGELEADALRWLDAEEVPAEARRLQRLASLRYQHQGFELTVRWAGDTVDNAAVQGTIDRFHALHEQIYSFAQPDTPVEITTIRIDAIGTFAPPALPKLPEAGRIADAIIGRSQIMLEGGAVDSPIYERSALGVDEKIAGPCLVCQLDATTLLLPGDVGRVHPLGSLIITNSA